MKNINGRVFLSHFSKVSKITHNYFYQSLPRTIYIYTVIPKQYGAYKVVYPRASKSEALISNLF